MDFNKSNSELLMGEHSPLLSFVMLAWKGAWLAEAIESILAQTYKNIELIVVDDCSPEDLRSIVERYDDPRISYHRNEKNLGGIHLTKQWMHCVGLAKGEYVVIASDDDVYDIHFAESCMAKAILYPNVNIIRAGVKDVDEEGRVLWTEATSQLSGDCISQAEYTWAYRQGIVSICMGNLVFRRSELLRKGVQAFPRALGSDIAVSIDLAEQGMALADPGLFAFRHSTVHLSGSLTQLEPKMEAINLFYGWVMNYAIAPATDPVGQRLQAELTVEHWRIKCVYDYLNQVIRYVSPSEVLKYLARAKYASSWDKCKMLLRYIKYRWIGRK